MSITNITKHDISVAQFHVAKTKSNTYEFSIHFSNEDHHWIKTSFDMNMVFDDFNTAIESAMLYIESVKSKQTK